MFGALPVDDVRFVPLSGRFPFGGMGLLGTILIGDFITFPEFDYMIEQGAAHELAHSWWGGMTSTVDPTMFSSSPSTVSGNAQFSATVTKPNATDASTAT